MPEGDVVAKRRTATVASSPGCEPATLRGIVIASPTPIETIAGASPPTPRPVGAVGHRLVALQDQLRHTQYWPVERMLRHQLRQLGELADHAYRTRPFYRARLAACGYRPGLPITAEFWSALPILTRREVQDHFADITEGRVPPDHLPFLWDSTSGSSGMPLKIKRTQRTQLIWLAAALREHLWHRRDFRGKLATIRRTTLNDAFPPDGKRFPDWGAPVAAVYPTGPLLVLDNRSTIEQHTAWLLREQPNYLLSTPSIIRELARHFRSAGLRLPSLWSLRSYGEAVGSDVPELCQEVFHSDLVDIYSSAELGYLALPSGEISWRWLEKIMGDDIRSGGISFKSACRHSRRRFVGR